ncbi:MULTISPECIES: hypothetical protein [unclassified Nonomuraea]|uniref:hypothetical protein n=1 Tax=unclassified Nonomuraea TaxID=2593643 RepID=UPI00191C34A5|nr:MULTISPECIES: hypothetical protein [unclassified Nonomuraea]
MAAFISSQKTEHDVDHTVSCRALGVSQSWYYKWKNRIGEAAPTARQRRSGYGDHPIVRGLRRHVRLAAHHS